MALKRLLPDLSIISKLGKNPGLDDGLSEEQFKAKFDEAANIIKDYLNNYLILEIEKTVDVESLLSDILDVTLSKEDKAANAAATGEAIRGLRSFFEKVVHGGDYVLESDGNFSAELSGVATVRIKGGEGVMQGNLFSLNLGSYEDVELTEGTYGLSRNDLIVVRCEKNEDNSLKFSLAALKGENTSGAPADPQYTTGDINGNDNVREFPIYRIRFDGYDITNIVPLFIPEKRLKQYVDSKHFDAVILVPAAGWQNESAPYTQTIAVDGIVETDNPHYGAVYSEDADTRQAEKEAFSLVDDLETADGSITFTCFEDKPEVDLNIQLEVNR